jgi:hypothetical protein
MPDISREIRLEGGVGINRDIGSLSQGLFSHLQNEAQRSAVAFCVPLVHSWKPSGLAVSGADVAGGTFPGQEMTCKRCATLEI